MKWASFVSVKVILILPTFWRLLRFGLISARAGYLANMTSREVSYKIIIFIYIFINYTYSSVRRMYLSFIRFVKHVPSGTYTCETTMATYPLKLFIHRKWTMFKMFIFQFYSNLVHHIGYFYYFWLCYFWVIQHIFCFCIFFRPVFSPGPLLVYISLQLKEKFIGYFRVFLFSHLHFKWVFP